MFLIDTNNKKAKPLERKSFSELKLTERNDLQEWIADNPSILGENLLIIQKEFDGFSDTNERLDLLALDESGRLVIIENKLDDTGKNVVWQALKYVSYCATLTKSEICEIYGRYLGDSAIAADKLAEFYDEQDFESLRLNPVEGEQRIILVAANFRKEVTSTVLWLSNYHGVDIKCIKVTPYKDEENLYLDTEQIIPIQDVGDYQIRLTAKKQEEAISSNEEAARYKTRNRFWAHTLPILRGKTGIYNNVSPTKDNWISGASGHSGIGFSCIIRMDGARAELFISTNDKEKNKRIFHALMERKDSLEPTFAKTLDWRELPDKNTSCISIHFHNFGLNDEEHWDDIADFLANNIAMMQKEFKPLIDDLLKG